MATDQGCDEAIPGRSGSQGETRNWPATIEGSPTVKNLFFYEDPDYGFTFQATVRKLNLITSVHDHGEDGFSTG